jgi:hypothetical protein
MIILTLQHFRWHHDNCDGNVHDFHLNYALLKEELDVYENKHCSTARQGEQLACYGRFTETEYTWNPRNIDMIKTTSQLKGEGLDDGAEF